MTLVRKIPGELPVSFRYTPGVGNTAFFEALRDRGVLLGSRCDACGVTYLPARIFCERCLAGLDPRVECGPAGTLESWTVGHVGIDGEALDEPVALGLVRFDGADTVVLHRLLGDAEWSIGMRVEAVLRAERVASILDLEGVRPA
jgi:uncharacterized OB-fold protein